MVAATLALIFAYQGLSSIFSEPEQSASERLRIYDVSPARVEAINLAETGRDLIFPAVDLVRLQLSLQVFEATKKKDPTYFGGHAGAAQIHATIAVLALDREIAKQHVDKARENSQRALALAPEAAWALSAAAWTAFADRDRSAARSFSDRAVLRDPNDTHIGEFHSQIALYSSDFEYVIEQVREHQSKGVSNKHHVFQNTAAAALFHSKDYAGSIDLFEDAIASGAPFGPISIVYLIAANNALGQTEKAETLNTLLQKHWPEAQVTAIKKQLFFDTAPADQLQNAVLGQVAVE